MRRLNMEWKFQKVMNAWVSSQEKNNIKLTISLVQKDSNLLVIDLDDTKALLFFSLSVGKEKESGNQDNSFFDKDSVSSKMKELEDLFDISKWGDSPQKKLFKELQSKIIDYLDNLYLDPPNNEG